MARKVDCERTGPAAGFNVAEPEDGAFMLMVVRDAWLLSRATRSLSGRACLSRQAGEKVGRRTGIPGDVEGETKLLFVVEVSVNVILR